MTGVSTVPIGRPYVCLTCGYTYQTNTTRGPVPLYCPTCKQSGKRPGSRVSPTPGEFQKMELVKRALAMRTEYKSWPEIAETLGQRSGMDVKRVVTQEMDRRRAELADTIDEFRDRELEHLDQLSAVAMGVLQRRHYLVNSGAVVIHNDAELMDDGPTLAAVATLVRVSESRRKLLGLDVAQKVDASVTVNYSVTGIPESEMP